MGTDFSQFKKLRDELAKFQANEIDAFCQACAKELAARLLAKVIRRTPVGKGTYLTKKNQDGKRVKYKKGKNAGKFKKVRVKTGGTLRRGWTTQQSGSGAEGLNGGGAHTYADSLKVHKFGDTYVVEIINAVEYASYVEFGHRTSNHKGWVPGQFMLTISEKEIREIAPQLLEKRIQEKLMEVIGRAT